MKILVGFKPLKQDTTYNSYSVLLEIDWKTKEILRILKIPAACFSSKEGYMRSNIQGCVKDGDKVYVSQWNYISVIDYESFRIIDSFSHPYMSDIHGIAIRDDELLITSTGIDAVLIFDKKTYQYKNIWRAEDSILSNKYLLPTFLKHLRVKSSTLYKRLKDMNLNSYLVKNFKIKFNANKEYRGLDKTRSGLHSHHLNEVTVFKNNIYILTKGWNDTISGSLIKLSNELKNEEFILKPGSLKGPHDIVFKKDLVIFTESDNESVAQYDLKNNNLKRYKLRDNDYFVRGLELCGDNYLVGFTPSRKEKNNRNPFIVEYSNDLSEEISKMEFDLYDNKIGGAVHFIYRVELSD